MLFMPVESSALSVRTKAKKEAMDLFLRREKKKNRGVE